MDRRAVVVDQARDLGVGDGAGAAAGQRPFRRDVPDLVRIADEVRELFPDARIALVTSDTLNSPEKIGDFVAAAEEGLIDAVDGFCEGIAFSPEQIARLRVVLAEINRQLASPQVELRDLSNRYGKTATRDGHLELWFPAGPIQLRIPYLAS